MKNILYIFLATFALVACSPKLEALEQTQILLRTSSGEHVIRVDIADNAKGRRQGLQNRRQLAPDQGMLFDFHAEQPVSFWMKNTPLALDMFFFTRDGKLVQISENNTPYSTDPIPSRQPVRYVLEMLAGSAFRLKADMGDTLVIPPN
jgi:uncharacterized membrane protein (UPF0127 family)